MDTAISLLSSRTTAVWKWSSPAAGVVFLIYLARTGEIHDAGSLAGPLLLLGACGVFHALLVWNLADEVFDHGDHLRIVRRGREARVPMASVSAVRISLDHRPRRIVLELAVQTPLGNGLAFIPGGGPGRLASPTELGQSILRRAQQAREGPARSSTRVPMQE